jgi:hypothetical protein
LSAVSNISEYQESRLCLFNREAIKIGLVANRIEFLQVFSLDSIEYFCRTEFEFPQENGCRMLFL